MSFLLCRLLEMQGLQVCSAFKNICGRKGAFGEIEMVEVVPVSNLAVIVKCLGLYSNNIIWIQDPLPILCTVMVLVHELGHHLAFKVPKISHQLNNFLDLKPFIKIIWRFQYGIKGIR